MACTARHATGGLTTAISIRNTLRGYSLGSGPISFQFCYNSCMNKQTISLREFVDAFQVIIGKPIWRVIHPADGWLTIDLGQKYTDSLPGKGGQDEPYQRGQYQLHIIGDWEVYTNGSLFESRQVNDNDQSAYFSRMDVLVNDFPLTSIDSIVFENDNLILKGDNSELRVPISDTSESISLSYVELDSDNKPTSYTHYRYDDAIGKLVTTYTK